jgi:NAD(P)-dependent dehydrogenase (short-subunit alcohol dehydrogenase family)
MDGHEGSYQGKVAVVTGAASGIGLALAQRFAAEGMRVVLADVARDDLQTAAKSLAGTHGEDHVAAVPTDVREPEAVDALARATVERFGAVHVVCNNAGVAVGGLAWQVPADRWRWIVDVNLHGVVNGIRSFVPLLIEQGEGHVVNTASVAGFITSPAMSPYLATKHAVVAVSEALYFDLQVTGATGVGVSVLCPEWVRTRIAESDRNRPADVSPMVPGPELAAGSDDGEAAGPATLLQGFIDTGLDPAAVADHVVDAIRQQRFWIFTHPTSLPSIKRRWQAVEDDARPVWWGG